VERLHREHGVRVLTGTAVRELVGDGRVRAVVTGNGDRIGADVVVVGIGIEPAVELAAEAGIRVANGIVVDEHCVTSNPAVYAAGDVTWHPNAIVGHEVRLEQWANAQNQAVSAARSMLGRPETYATVPWFWSDQYGTRIEMAGLPAASDSITWRGDPGTLGTSAFFLRDGLVVGAVAFDRPRDVRAAMTMIENKLPVAPEALADETVDLRRLTRSAIGPNA
jgi:3-phenylpropionate/trans-cinnamate dioxygenase ferredoxin reductase subunit